MAGTNNANAMLRVRMVSPLVVCLTGSLGWLPDAHRAADGLSNGLRADYV
jgi:hypothetical protein